MPEIVGQMRQAVVIILALHSVIVWLAFFEFKVLPSNWPWRIDVLTSGVAVALTFVALINTLVPQGRLVAYGHVAEIAPVVAVRVYPISEVANAPVTMFNEASGKQINTVYANDFHFHEKLNTMVQHVPVDFVQPETVGLFAAIGMKKGRTFAPDARMTPILTDAVAVVGSHDPRKFLHPASVGSASATFPAPGGRLQQPLRDHG